MLLTIRGAWSPFRSNSPLKQRELEALGPLTCSPGSNQVFSVGEEASLHKHFREMEVSGDKHRIPKAVGVRCDFFSPSQEILTLVPNVLFFLLKDFSSMLLGFSCHKTWIFLCL